jgi:hypothetical protein
VLGDTQVGLAAADNDQGAGHGYRP